MNVLAIDTTHAFCSASVLSDENGRLDVVHSERHEIGRGHAEKLLHIIETTLQKAGLRREEIGRIVVNTGPGSFTGLRVGVAAARGLALALKCDCVGVTALEGLARECPVTTSKNGCDEILVLIHAGRGEVVCQTFDGDTREARSSARTLSVEQARLEFSVFQGIAIGSGTQDCFGSTSGSALSISPHCWPDIETIGRIGAEPTRTGPASPFYSRAADAKPQTSSNLVAKSDSDPK